MVKENYKYVLSKVEEACKRSGRSKDEVTLIAVSKTKPVSMIYEAIEAGAIDFGENKVQELSSKYEEISDENLKWHLIGHLQTNKVKYIVDKTFLIHSVDSLKLAQQIDKEAKKKDVICDILIEVNIASEDTKFGIKADECEKLIREIAKLSNVRVKGLMTIAPFVDNQEENRIYFHNLRKLFVDIKTKSIDNVFMEILSMGMTNDYEIAIEEGATMVRVGTGIFGERDYTNRNL